MKLLATVLVLLEPFLALAIGHCFHAVVSLLPVVNHRPRGGCGDENKYESADAGPAAPQRQSDRQGHKSQSESVNRKRIEEHVDVFRLLQTFKKSFEHWSEMIIKRPFASFDPSLRLERRTISSRFQHSRSC